MAEPMIVFDQLITADYCKYDTAQDAVDAMFVDAKKINKASLYYSWAVGKFIGSDKFKQKYSISLAELATMMGTSENSLYRYKTVAKRLSRHELEKLAELGVSTNAIMEIARIDRTHKEEAKLLFNALLNGEVLTKNDISEEFTELLKSRTEPHNLLPCADKPGEEVEESIKDITKAIVVEDSGESPGDNIIKSPDIVDAKIVKDADDYEDDDDSLSLNFKDKEESQNVKDAKAMLKNIRNYLAPLRRDIISIKENLVPQMEKIRADYSVVLGDKDSTAICDDLIFDIYKELIIAFQFTVDELLQGVKTGNIMNPIPISEDAEHIFDGKPLFTYSE